MNMKAAYTLMLAALATFGMVVVHGRRHLASLERAAVASRLRSPLEDPFDGGPPLDGPEVLPAHQRPYIGILALPEKSSGMSIQGHYIQAAFEKFLSAAGAIPTPIPPDLPLEQVDELYYQLNGVLFTGGPGKPTDFPEYFQIATRLYNLTLQAADDGEWVPLWGTCLGMQAIADMTAGGKDILSEFTGVQKVALPLEWIAANKAASRLFGKAGVEVVELFDRSTTSNRHSYGITPEDFATYMEPAGFRLISVNSDTKGSKFVSTIEHSTAPIYGVQWHPEASQFNENSWIERTIPDIAASQYIGRFIVEQARMNDRRPMPGVKLPRVEDLARQRSGYWQELHYILPEGGGHPGKDLSESSTAAASSNNAGNQASASPEDEELLGAATLPVPAAVPQPPVFEASTLPEELVPARSPVRSSSSTTTTSPSSSSSSSNSKKAPILYKKTEETLVIPQ